MPAGNEVLTAGTFNVSLNGVSLGMFEGEQGVPNIIKVPKSRPVNSTSRYGNTKIDSIRMGGDYMFEAVLMEFAKAAPVLNFFELFGLTDVPGLLKWPFAAPLVLTAVAGSTAAAFGPATITAPRAVPADDFPTRLSFGPQLRTVAVRFDLLPADLNPADLSPLRTIGAFTQA